MSELYEVWQHLHFMLNVSWSLSEAAMIHRSCSEVTATFVAFGSVRDGFRAPSIVASPLRPSSHPLRTTKVWLVQCSISKDSPLAVQKKPDVKLGVSEKGRLPVLCRVSFEGG